jgi:hypothetical protein
MHKITLLLYTVRYNAAFRGMDVMPPSLRRHQKLVVLSGAQSHQQQSSLVSTLVSRVVAAREKQEHVTRGSNDTASVHRSCFEIHFALVRRKGSRRLSVDKVHLLRTLLVASYYIVLLWQNHPIFI